MIKVKISAITSKWSYLRQTPNSEGIWGDYQFFINQENDDYDFWVVHEGFSGKETAICNKNNIILFTGEPPSVKKYNPRFLKQFAAVITCHKDIKHKNVIINQQALPWVIGLSQQNERFINYDSLKANKNFKKTKLLSVISSNKNFTKGHVARLNFVERLKEHFGSEIDVFGSGINGVNDKYEAIADYKYHIVLENSQYPNYWTEKLSDCYLGYAYPFYYGCTNISEYFPAKSYTPIDINKPDEAISIIENTIKNNIYEISKEQIQQARELILDKYNLFPMIVKICNGMSSNGKKEKITLKREHRTVLTKISKKLKRWGLI